MTILEKEYLQDLYLSGKSMSDIAILNNISVHKVTYWMKKYNIQPRNRSTATYIKHNPEGDPFKIIDLNCATIRQKELLALGIALFLGEGTKKQKYGVRFANSDPRIINLFLSFLKNICGVKYEKLRAWINIFDDLVYEDSLNFWSKQTKISKNQFYSPVIRKQKIGTYKNKSKYGTITIIVDNKKLLDQIKIWCDKYLNSYLTI